MTVSIRITAVHGSLAHESLVVPTDPSLDAVLFDFNPTSNGDAVDIKALCAALIEKLRPIQAAGGAKGHNASIAITEIEDAHMLAVKALFAK